MGTSMLVMPTHKGWSVTWETGEMILNHKGEPMKRNGKVVMKHNSYETTDRARAEAKAKEMRAQGFKNVTIYECIF